MFIAPKFNQIHKIQWLDYKCEIASCDLCTLNFKKCSINKAFRKYGRRAVKIGMEATIIY